MTSLHDDWLSLIDISGPFLAVPVLKEAFPQGLEELDGTKRKRLRQAYEEWRDALEQDDPQLDELHSAWIDEVLSRGLELDEDGKGDVLKRADWCTINLKAVLPDHGVALSPDQAVVDEQRANKPMMLIHTYAQDIDLDAMQKLDGWVATPADRMVQLCRTLGCRLGLITNGERWMLVDAPVGAVTSFASWYARLWGQEPITLQAFVHLLGIRRFFVDESEQLPALFDVSLKYQDEVTDALGEQVRRAVEVLIQSLDKADQDRNRELLHDVKESELYEAALTVMMRLVFLLSAEERGLLLLGDERYEANYALSTLRMQLRKESEEILERRWDAWSRLLAIFRAVYCGVEHENLRLPALGSSLFDPDHFPFLEGRAKGSNWRIDTARPLPIDNRTVLLLLEAIQQFQGRALSYRALDVEQIGYVYEGLLERTVKRTDEVTLELDATKKSQSPWVKLAELDAASSDSAERLVKLLQERSGCSVSRVRNSLFKPVDDTLADRLLTTCQGDLRLRDRIKPYAHLLRTDPWGYPLVYPAGAFIVTSGSNRRETGTHYTPKSLTEAIVTETLTPVVYIGPSDGIPREQWQLKSPAELLDLKICDPAMGSGAFLVQACRWLADRLVEAWSLAEANGNVVSVDGDVLDLLETQEPLPRDMDARIIIARRLIAERCLYGVDLNPLAVELAKLSIWLVTLAKGRPFGFLDHSLRCGDSLLGIHRLDQLTELSMTPNGQGQQRLFGQNIERAVQEAITLRQQLRAMPIRDIHDVEAMFRLDTEARQALEVPERIGDALIGEAFAAGGNGTVFENALTSLTIQSGRAIDGDCDSLALLKHRSVTGLSVDLPTNKPARRSFHWPLEFPEVFVGARDGFDAVVSNPPFLGGQKITAAFGTAYRNYLVKYIANGQRGSADFCAYFFLRVSCLLRRHGMAGLLATNTIAQGDTREVCLEQLIGKDICIPRAISSCPWPGAAALEVSEVWMWKGKWKGACTLDGLGVIGITAFLTSAAQQIPQPYKLKSNEKLSFIGSIPLGAGFLLTPGEAKQLIEHAIENKEILKPYISGDDVLSNPDMRPSRWVIDFGDRSLEDAQAYPDLLAIVEEKVKPERDKNNRKTRREKWWQFAERSPSLYEAISPLAEVFFHSFTSKYVAFGLVSARQSFAGPHVVIASEDKAVLGVLQSAFHECWARAWCSTHETRLRYAPSDLLETFPFPELSDELRSVAVKYETQRRSMMLANSEGMTKTYNRMHDPECFSDDVETLRKLAVELDREVAKCYGFPNVELGHGFHETKQGVRFVISESARLEVVKSLAELNHLRYEEEVAHGLHGNGKVRTPRRATRTTSAQPSFDFEAKPASTSHGTPATTVILDFLCANPHWHAKADVLAATNITDGQWNTAISGLITGSKVERKGERRGARYRAVDAGGAAQ